MTAKPRNMLRPPFGPGHQLREEDLERQLLRQSVGLLQEDRHACCDCGRTPLVGERVHRFSRGEIVCELCRPLHAGQPQSSDLVRHFERGQTVRLLRQRLAA